MLQNPLEKKKKNAFSISKYITCDAKKVIMHLLLTFYICYESFFSAMLFTLRASDKKGLKEDQRR